MRKSVAILCGAALIGLTGQAVAQSAMKDDKMATKKEMRMQAMDANNDGMVSREEFMKYHENMWNKTKRNPAGMAMMADVEAMYGPGVVPSAIPGEAPKKARP